jgi:hypothetical protein
MSVSTQTPAIDNNTQAGKAEEPHNGRHSTSQQPGLLGLLQKIHSWLADTQHH